jgi:hypothetical protein
MRIDRRPISSRTTCAGLLTFLHLAGVTGCENPPPPAAATNLGLTPEEQRTRQVLDPDDQAVVWRTFRSLAEGHDPVNPPRTPAQGMAWEDVPAAVAAACDDIEAAVMSVDESEDQYLYTLRTVEDWPGELLVRRADDRRVYVAQAWIGLFPDDPARVARAEALLDALERQLRAYGRKTRFIDAPAVN